MAEIVQLTIPEPLWRQMADHLQQALPEEGCGLVGGTGNVASVVIPVENELHSPVRFSMQPLELLHGLTTLEKQGLDLVAIFHSHPQGPPEPSATDIAEFRYPSSIYLIWFRTNERWNVRGFNMEETPFQEILLTISEDT